MAAPMYNVFVGSEIGLLKGVNVTKESWTNLSPVEAAKKENEICDLCWDNDRQTKFLVGLKCQKILKYTTADENLGEELSYDMGKGRLRNIARVNENIVTSVSSGVIRHWEDNENFTEIQAGDNLFFMSQNQTDREIIATGGKENELKIWNWNSPDTPVFQAKNVRNDWLNLRVPVWVLGAQFLPDGEKIVTCTGHHQVRVYDPKSQRRPVLDMTFGENPITALSVNNQNDKQVVVGNTCGMMGLLDIRKGSMVQLYKGFTGGIRRIQCHQSLSLIASCGLDRFLRIHDLKSKELLHKIYLKSRLNCLLFSDKFHLDETQEEEEEKPLIDTDSNENIVDDVEDEDIWEKLEVVKTKTKQKNEKKELTIFSPELMEEPVVKKKRKSMVFDEFSPRQTRSRSTKHQDDDVTTAQKVSKKKKRK